jgi:hypothetical protein
LEGEVEVSGLDELGAELGPDATDMIRGRIIGLPRETVSDHPPEARHEHALGPLRGIEGVPFL